MDNLLRVAVEDGKLQIEGRLLINTIDTISPFGTYAVEPPISVIDVSKVSHLDTAGAWALLDLQSDGWATLHGATDAQTQLIEIVKNNMGPEALSQSHASSLTAVLRVLGKRVAKGGQTALAMISFFGQVIAAIITTLFRPKQLRLTSLVHHCQEVGLNAVPIVALMAFLIGVVLAFQGATQLRQFGAEVFVVDLIAISILRELGILLTAIIVAGRSGAAFTAAIGAMKMREEVDALRTLGLDPIMVLVVPRVLALMLMLPLLGFIADMAGLLGGAVMAWIELGVSPAVFQARLLSNTDVWHFAIGIIKAPIFAVIIGIVGCYQGMTVGGNAESLGRLTSTSVVQSIFLVIVVDALFSIFFAVVGI